MVDYVVQRQASDALTPVAPAGHRLDQQVVVARCAFSPAFASIWDAGPRALWTWTVPNARRSRRALLHGLAVKAVRGPDDARRTPRTRDPGGVAITLAPFPLFRLYHAHV